MYYFIRHEQIQSQVLSRQSTTPAPDRRACQTRNDYSSLGLQSVEEIRWHFASTSALYLRTPTVDEARPDPSGKDGVGNDYNT